MSNISIYNESLLLSRLADDDMAAFDELYWKYQAAVYQNVYKLTKDTIISEDIVQEVFIGLWEKRNSIDTSRSVGGWIFVSSYNRTINILKKSLKESLVFKDIAQTESTNIEDQEITEIQFQILENAIANLSPQRKRVFELCKLEGKSYNEAAEIMNISKHTVKEYLSAAVISIKEYAANHTIKGITILTIVDCFL